MSGVKQTIEGHIKVFTMPIKGKLRTITNHVVQNGVIVIQSLFVKRGCTELMPKRLGDRQAKPTGMRRMKAEARDTA
jgi:hypothetical protein